MTNKISYLRGHKIEFLNGEFVYSDSKESTIDNYKIRPCGHCGLYNTNNDHDGCLGELIGVDNACCGHGVELEAYIQFSDGKIIKGKDVKLYLNQTT